MCVSACRERPLCTMFTFFYFDFFFFFLPPNSDSFCAPQWSQSAVQTVRFPPCTSAYPRRTQRPPPPPPPPRPQQCRFAAIPPFFFFLFVSIRVCPCVCLFTAWREQKKKILCVLLCVCFFCAFRGDSLCACAWPQRHFTQLSHPITSSTAASPFSFE